MRGSSWTSACLAYNAAGAGIDIDRRAAPIGSNDLETIDPFVGKAEEVDGDDIAGIPRFDNAQDVVKRMDLAVFIKLARAVLISVAVGTDGKWHRRRKSGKAADH